MKLFAVIPTIGERNATLVPMVERLAIEGVTVIIVDNGPEPLEGDDFPVWTHFHRHDWNGMAVNLSELWNMGLDWAQDLAHGEEFVVAVFNDDLVLPPYTVQQLADGIMTADAAAAFIRPYGLATEVYGADTPLTLGNRMVGYAFALRGSKQLRADERFMWWWGDTDLDIQARAAGGVVGMSIWGLGHLDPNGYTNRRPELYEQAGRDGQAFLEKHGFRPW